MDTYIATETRAEYSDPIIVGRPVPLKRIPVNPANDLADWSISKTFPFISRSYRTLFEERSVQPDSNTRDTWNDFEHYKVSGVFPSEATRYYTRQYGLALTGHTFVLPGTRWTWSDAMFGPADLPINGLPQLYAKNNVTGRFVKTVNNVDSLINTAVRQMLGEARPGTSLINSLLELKDIRSLPRHTKGALEMLNRVRKDLPLALQGISQLHRRVARTSLLRVLGVLSGALLQSEFNLRPLYKDIVEVNNALHTVRDAILKKMRDDGVRRRRDYNMSLDKDYVDSDTLSAAYVGPGSTVSINDTYPSGMTGRSRIRRNVRYTHKLFHAQVEYSKYYSEYQRQNAEILLLLDKLGVMFDPSIVWNAIPWSFAIDWVIGVNRWLEQFRMANMEPVTLIHKFCWSQRTRRILHCTIMSQEELPPSHRAPIRIASSVVEDAYIRSTQRLNVVAALTGSGINSREFILASALALSRQR